MNDISEAERLPLVGLDAYLTSLPIVPGPERFDTATAAAMHDETASIEAGFADLYKLTEPNLERRLDIIQEHNRAFRYIRAKLTAKLGIILQPLGLVTDRIGDVRLSGVERKLIFHNRRLLEVTTPLPSFDGVYRSAWRALDGQSWSAEAFRFEDGSEGTLIVFRVQEVSLPSGYRATNMRFNRNSNEGSTGGWEMGPTAQGEILPLSVHSLIDASTKTE